MNLLNVVRVERDADVCVCVCLCVYACVCVCLCVHKPWDRRTGLICMTSRAATRAVHSWAAAGGLGNSRGDFTISQSHRTPH